MTGWVRLWEDMPTDPKWRTIARKAGQRVGDVIALFNLLMVCANGSRGERGALCDGFDLEDAATMLDIGESDVRAIMEAMQGKVLDGQRLTGWDKRQPKREDGTVAERTAAWRERQRNAKKRKETHGDAEGTHGDAPDSDSDSDSERRVLSPNGDSPSGDGEAVLLPEHIRESFNKLATELGRPSVRDLTPERRALVKGRIQQYSLDDFKTVFAKCRDSPFLRGDRGRTPLAFDWLMKKANFQKVLEGNYDG